MTVQQNPENSDGLIFRFDTAANGPDENDARWAAIEDYIETTGRSFKGGVLVSPTVAYVTIR